MSVAESPSLHRDLELSARIRSFAADEEFALVLYRTLSNNRWRHAATNERQGVTWRMADKLVSFVRGEKYGSWYCSGGEGAVDPRVVEEFTVLGWELVQDAD